MTAQFQFFYDCTLTKINKINFKDNAYAYVNIYFDL